MGRTSIIWFLQDLRLADNPALTHACIGSGAIVPAYLWTPEEYGGWTPGAAARWWLHESLGALDRDLRAKGSRLVLRQGGTALELLRSLIRDTGADTVLWNARYEPALRSRDQAVYRALRDDGIAVQVFPSRLLHDPRAVKTKGGQPFQVFSAFWNRFQDEVEVGADLGRPRLGSGRAPAVWPEGTDLDDLGLHPRHVWAAGLDDGWNVGEAAAHRRLQRFTAELLSDYPAARELPDRDGSSRLSPHLHHGELSPRQVWNAVVAQVGTTASRSAADAYLREIGWREFAYHLLYHNPETPTQPMREKFAAFPWRRSRAALQAWQKGRTGYPLVDAGIRQLWRTGWMHNRVRMVVASFLTKDLLIPWLDGARWFWDTLVDADLASNTLGWQWVAGSGADAQPFFRIFNPVSQSRKFDADGGYIRAWVPELARLPAQWIHWPGAAPDEVLRAAGVRLGETYPKPMVDHADARDRALEAYNTL